MAIVPLIPSPHLRVDGPASRPSAATDARRGDRDIPQSDVASGSTPASFQSIVNRRLASQRDVVAGAGRPARRSEEPPRDDKTTSSEGNAYAPVAGVASLPTEASPAGITGHADGMLQDVETTAEFAILAPQTAKLAEIARALKNNTLPQDADVAHPAGDNPAFPSPPGAKPGALAPAPSAAGITNPSETSSDLSPTGALETMAMPEGGKPAQPALAKGLSEALRRLQNNPEMAPRTPASSPAAAPATPVKPIATDGTPATAEGIDGPALPDLSAPLAPATGKPVDASVLRPSPLQTVESEAPSAVDAVTHTSSAAHGEPLARAVRMAAQTYQRQAAFSGATSDMESSSGVESRQGPSGFGTVEGLSAPLRAVASQPAAAPEPPVSTTSSSLVSTILDHVKQTLKVYPEKQSATFDVRPPELGKIRIEITMGPDNTARAIVQAQTAHGQEALQRNAAQLYQEFERQGLPEPELRFSMDAHQDARQSAEDFARQRQQQDFQDGDRAPLSRTPPVWNTRDPAVSPRIRGPAIRSASGRINLTV